MHDIPARDHRQALHSLRADISRKVWAGEFALARLCLNEAEEEQLHNRLLTLYAKRRAIDSELANLQSSVPFSKA